MGSDIHVAEFPGHQISCCGQLLFGKIIATPYFFEHSFANWNWPFDDRVDQLERPVELEMDCVDVVPSVDVADVWDALAEVVGHAVSVTLDNSMDCPFGQRVHKLSHFIFGTWLLDCVFGSIFINKI